MARKVLKRTATRLKNRSKRKARVRKKVIGTPERPRLCVTKTNRSLMVQLVDDRQQVTILGLRGDYGKTVNRDAAKALGKTVAEKAKAKGISAVVFDRSGFAFHGRIKALADGAREAGLQF